MKVMCFDICEYQILLMENQSYLSLIHASPDWYSPLSFHAHLTPPNLPPPPTPGWRPCLPTNSVATCKIPTLQPVTYATLKNLTWVHQPGYNHIARPILPVPLPTSPPHLHHLAHPPAVLARSPCQRWILMDCITVIDLGKGG